MRRGARFREQRASEAGRRRHHDLGVHSAGRPDPAPRALANGAVGGTRERFEEILQGARVSGGCDENHGFDQLASPADPSGDLDRLGEAGGGKEVAQPDRESRRFREQAGAPGPGGSLDARQDLLRAGGSEPGEGGEASVAAGTGELGEGGDAEALPKPVDLLRPETGNAVERRERLGKTRPEVLEVREASGRYECRDLVEDRRADPGNLPERAVGDGGVDLARKGRERPGRIGIGPDLEFVLAGQPQELADLLQERGDLGPVQGRIPAGALPAGRPAATGASPSRFPASAFTAERRPEWIGAEP
jgi:hypothetical protein